MVNHRSDGKKGYALKISELSSKELAQIKKDCTVITKVLKAFQSFQKPKRYVLYTFSPDKEFIYIPRYYAFEKIGKPKFISFPKEKPVHDGLNCLYKPLEHQKAAIAKLEETFGKKKQIGAGGLLSLPCGYGKTFCAIWTIIEIIKLRGIIVVPTSCLMNQWMEAIAQIAPDAKVGSVQRSKVDVEGKDIVVVMLHSLCLKEYRDSVFNDFSVAVYDECHHIASEMFCKSMIKLRCRYTLGLSATPVRKDGLSEIIHMFIGPLIHKERRSGKNNVVIKKLRLLSENPAYQTQYLPNGTKNTSRMTTEISKFKERNILLHYILYRLVAQGRKILVISSRKDHLREIKGMLDHKPPKTREGTGATSGFYFGRVGMGEKDHKKMLEESSKCDIVLGIDSLAKEGLDIPDRNTLVWATPPGCDIEQPSGRILRKIHTDLNPLIVDLVDNTGNYVKHSSDRDKWFREQNYVIEAEKIELLGDPGLWKEKVKHYMDNPGKIEKQKGSKKEKEKEKEEIYFQCLLED